MRRGQLRSLSGVTHDIRTEFPTVLPSRDHAVQSVPDRAQHMEADTVAAIASAVVGVECVLVSAVGVIALCVAPLGTAAVVLASVVTGAVATTILAGGVWAWFTDRAGRGVVRRSQGRRVQSARAQRVHVQSVQGQSVQAQSTRAVPEAASSRRSSASVGVVA